MADAPQRLVQRETASILNSIWPSRQCFPSRTIKAGPSRVQCSKLTCTYISCNRSTLSSTTIVDMSNGTPGADEHPPLIPRPRSLAQCLFDSSNGETLCEQMGLPTDAFKSLVDISRKLACRYLDAGLSWKEQDGRALKRYDDEVRRAWPSIDEYANHWPLQRMTPIFLRDLRTQLRKGSSSRAKHTLQNVESGGQVPLPRVHSRPRHPILPRHRSISATFIGRRPPSLPLPRPSFSNIQSSQHIAEPSLNPDLLNPHVSHRQGRSQSIQPDAPGNASTSHAPVSIEAKKRPGRSSVERFLAVCKLPTETIMPKLRAAGIENPIDLSAIASLSDRDDWLDRHIKLSPLHFKLLTAGLTKLADRSSKDQQEIAH